MNIVAKMIGVKHPKIGFTYKTCHDESSTDVYDKNNLKDTVNDLLFVKGNNYVLVNFENKLYICEKINSEKYNRREINYHPLASLVSM